VRDLIRAASDALLIALIMLIGSFGLWVGTPLLWLYVGSQIEGSTQSLGTALSVMAIGGVLTISLVAYLLQRLSDVHRRTCVARGEEDPGHLMLEGVLAVSASITLVVFAIWFFLLAGASPIPIGLQI
jgi:hypothetical protein